jgi:hypothetical protein
MNLVHSLSMRKHRIFLLLPFALLLLQFGVALLHHHHEIFCDDHQDPIHQPCSDRTVVSKVVTKLKGRQTTRAALTAPITTLPAKKLALATAPVTGITNQTRMKACTVLRYRPNASSAKRAPPA